ncbi:AcrR family transcriptional regulator [Actinoalloteichus hoggarensis]|uniref:Putative HTH-type transcriptional regulator YfiR n=1 Tax=Actinoalloteichus hoggarensis TaxID=1470176 RepID=A0A221VYL7_9PSEU|nr:TetR/AcrR family transcriptional regulator [Actinoalloteichus hoggarensis]ASO18597.1 putative HTH-type transcriptional regulator YfiR [Actinoalloteichus hoggarensis]MBB5921965.1 AcrR family transcriptional regulator [Actinoalloteichus hoggarensis]
MPRTKEQYEALRAASLAKVQAAAITLFARRGFAATSMRDVARAAGISTGLIYRHYETKEELFAALVDYAAAGLHRVVERFGEAESPAELLDEFTRTFLTDLAGDGAFAEFFLIMNQAFMTHDESPQLQRLRTAHALLVDAVIALVGRGQERGEFRSGRPAELASCYLAALSGLATMRLLPDTRLAVPGPSTLMRLLLRQDDHDRGNARP